MIVPRRLVSVLALVALLSPFREAGASTPLTTVRVASGFSLPLYVTAAPGDTSRIFVVEQRGTDNRGRVKIVKNGVVLSTPFLTTGVLATGGEQGLLGLAFAPDYAATGRIYISYTDAGGTITLERRTVSGNPDVANATGTVILTIAHPFSNHNGGWLGFGPDGYLYFSQGDGGDSGDPGDRAQNLNVLLGKMLRLDVSGATYSSPSTNPFAGATPGLDEIWAFGLRNPWRPAFDSETGDFIIADVGQNVREEINFAAAGTGAGANYGWRCLEGTMPFAASRTTPCDSCNAPACPKIAPVYEYVHAGGRCSVTGGFVYRGCDIPDLNGTYFFGDYCTHQIWTGKFQGGSLVNVVERTAELAPTGGLALNNITSFGQDARGELYICDQDGEVYKIVPKVPVAQADMPALRTQIALGDTIGSSAPGNALLPGIVPFADAGSRIRGVGYLKDVKIRGCTDISGNCLTSQMRLGTFDIDLQTCVDPASGTLTRQFDFTNTAAGSQNLVYVDMLTPLLRGDPDQALMTNPASAGQSAVLAQYDQSPPSRWIVTSGVGSAGVFYSADVDTASQLIARVGADQPLAGAHSAGPQAVGMALGFDFGSIAAGAKRTVTLTTRYQSGTPTAVSPTPPPAPKAELRLLSPVPFRSDLRLEIELAAPMSVSLEVFDLTGRRVRTLARAALPAGRTPFRWDGKLESGTSAASGVYFLRLRSDSWSLTRKIALAR